MESPEILPHLFRMEYSRIVSVLCRYFGVHRIELAEDIAGDTFLAAAETWGLRGLPAQPVAWLYSVAKNRAADHYRREQLFRQKISGSFFTVTDVASIEVDLSEKNIADSQLQMMFAVCHPCIPAEAQVGLSLRILCGFGIEEIARAFLTSKETIHKRLQRAKEKLRAENVRIEVPQRHKLNGRLDNVLTTIYLLFNEGYYSAGHDVSLRKDLCLEAMRLTNLLLNEATCAPRVYALLALMCFQASRFEARMTASGEIILYDDQDRRLWNEALITKGEYFLDCASSGDTLSKFHLEAGIAYWHTRKAYNIEKWESILQLYNRLLEIEYSPVAALNRTYALARANGKAVAIVEAEKLQLTNSHLYHTLLGELYAGEYEEKACVHFNKAIALAEIDGERDLIRKKMRQGGVGYG